MKYTDANTPPPTEMILEFLAVVLMHGETFTGEQYYMAAVRYAGGYVWFGGA